jgi:hypothetical protein
MTTTHMTTAITDWTCPTCKTGVTTPFCPSCGEHPLKAHELTMHGLLMQVAKAVSNVDSKLLRSIKYLILQPGALTAAYQQGQRKPFFQPFPLFLMANVLFFAVQSLTEFRIFSTQIDLHLYRQAWSDLAQQLVIARLKDLDTTLDLYRPVFDRAMVVNAKTMIGLMIPALALVLPVTFLSSKQPLAVHAVFALHFYAFLLVLVSVPVCIMAVEPFVGGDGVMSQSMDDAVAIGLLLSCATYLNTAIGRVYGVSGAIRVVLTCVLTFAVAAIFLGYRFALFIITLYSA